MNRTLARLSSLGTGLVLCLGAAPALASSHAPAADRSASQASATPVFGSVSPRSGTSSGGTTITVTGSHLSGVTSVKVGGSPATDVHVAPGGTSLTAVTPAGLPGAQPIALVTASTKSKVTSSSVFTFNEATPAASATYTPQGSTVVGTGVEWVTGGTDYRDSQAGTPDPWVVAIGDPGTIPEVGDHYYLAPGTTAYPRGLAGTVSTVATQAGGLVTATVTPSDLSAVLSGVSVASAGPLGASPGQPTAPIVFGPLRPSAFTCTNSAGEPRRFRGVLHLQLAKVAHRFALTTADARVISWVRYDASLTGTVTVPNQMSCALRPEWAAANRKDLALAAPGLSVSLVPQARFSTTADGTYAVKQSSTRMVGLASTDGRARPVDARKNLGQGLTAADRAGRLTSEIGASARFAMLDRTGLDASAATRAVATVTARTNPRRACVSLASTATYAATGFLDLWLPGAGSPALGTSTPLSPSSRCGDPITPIAVNLGPVIRTDRLPEARNDTAYSEALATSDGRAGTWSVVTGSLPAGLSLNTATGEVHGTPTAHVGDHAFTIGFVDAAERRTTEVVRLFTGPETAVAGGDFQATLTWEDHSDLDLHVTDPSGHEIWYQHPTSPTGGRLDKDSNAGCAVARTEAHPVENVFWPPQQAPTGTYQVHVVRFDVCDTTTQPWHLVVRAYGRVVLDKTGEFTSPQTGDDADESAPVYSVTLGGDAAARRIAE